MSGSHTVLTNLLQNAAQRSPMGGTVQVYVDAETSNVASTASSPSTLEVPRDTPGESSMNLDGDVLLHIKVQDSGAAHITEKQWLSQADDPFLATGAEGGLGLSLHVCKHLVHQLGGVMWPERTIQGSFVVHLTLKMRTMGDRGGPSQFLPMTPSPCAPSDKRYYRVNQEKVPFTTDAAACAHSKFHSSKLGPLEIPSLLSTRSSISPLPSQSSQAEVDGALSISSSKCVLPSSPAPSSPISPMPLLASLPSRQSTHSGPDDATMDSSSRLSNIEDLWFLVVDDCKINVALLKTILKSAGAQHISEAKNGEEAMKELHAGMVKSRRYDIVYTDLRMPVMDGFQLAEAIRSDLPDEFQPVIFSVTAEGSSVFHRCRKVGISECLLKPINVEMIRSTLLHPEIGRRSSFR